MVVAPPFVHLDVVRQSLKPEYKVAAQNCWTGKPGAFTGEVPADMLVDMNIPWVILGHSERRCGWAELLLQLPFLRPRPLAKHRF